MLSKSMSKAINDQLIGEFFASNIYMSMASWCNHAGYDGSAKFFNVHKDEELIHMNKLYKYLFDCGYKIEISEIPKPPSNWNSLEEVFEAALNHEKEVTAIFNKLSKQAFDEGDFPTFQFLQWFCMEQHEEETVYTTWLDKLILFASDVNGLYMVDKEIGCSVK